METWTVRKIVAWMQSDFERRGIENARLDADLLVANALGVKRIVLFMDPDRPLIEAELTKIRALVERRRAREPIAYILGEREFYGRPFSVSRAVLIPRPDTETLVEAACTFLKRADAPEGAVLDLCTGSGAVAVTLAAELPTRSVVASDLSTEALEVARENAARHEATARLTFRHGDLFTVVRDGERFACITVNPPYIGAHEMAGLMPDVRDFEPRLALDAGDDALSFYRRIAAEAPKCLLPGGALFVEVGVGQAADVSALFREAAMRDVHALRDLAGIERVVGAQVA